MPIEGESLFRGREALLSEMVAAFQTAVPDAYMNEDGNLFLFLTVFSGTYESLFVGLDVLREDMFIQSANPQALLRHGTENGEGRTLGTHATGEILFSGAGGIVIPTGTQVAYDPGNGADLLYYSTTEVGETPNPGNPTAPTVADSGVAGNPDGTLEYVISFQTDAGETVPSPPSDALIISTNKVDISDIPLGGTGTIGRRIYRSKDGGDYKLVHTISDNTTTTYQDNIADGSLGGEPVEESTAESVLIPAEAEEPGSDYNAAVATVTNAVDVPDGITNVINPDVFDGGTDEETFEHFRTRLLEVVQNPHTGSEGDLESWAKEIDGVESAKVYKNTDADGDPLNGHVLVRISGPLSLIPDSDTIDAVQATLDARDMANATIHVGVFDSLDTDVEINVTTSDGFTLDDVTPSVTDAVTTYINSRAVGDPILRAGLTAAVYGLPGVENLVVVTPATDLTTDADTKRTVGTVTVS